jgi:hypothetical protein
LSIHDPPQDLPLLTSQHSWKKVLLEYVQVFEATFTWRYPMLPTSDRGLALLAAVLMVAAIYLYWPSSKKIPFWMDSNNERGASALTGSESGKDFVEAMQTTVGSPNPKFQFVLFSLK